VSEENLQIIRAAFEALTRGDEPARLDLVDPSVVGTPLPDLPDLQTFHGREGLLQAIDEWRESWDEYSIEVRQTRDLDDRVLGSCVQRGRGKGSGVQMEAETYFLFTFRGGKRIRNSTSR
jgi:ketosteroid isomerase-like protein